MSRANEASKHHVTPLPVYFRVWGALIVLTVITVLSSYVDLDALNILIAMAIASTKAILVILFFMGLKYEGQENTVTFFGAVVFLVIFVSLTAADIFYRVETEPVRVDSSGVPQAATGSVDVDKLAQPSPELVAKGKTLFGQQCASCHGPEGQGDGPAAAALVPKPRNFAQAEGWKKGRGLVEVFNTITEGLPGTPMPPFGTLSPEDRFALSHFVRSLGPNPPPADPQKLAELRDKLQAGGKPQLSIPDAMKKMAEEWERAQRP